MQPDFNKPSKTNWYTIFLIAVGVIVLIIASAVIYNKFFESDIKKEKNRQIAEQQMTETLESDSKEAQKSRAEADKLIEELNLDITGTYNCTYEESTASEEEKSQGLNYTELTKTTMVLNPDYTVDFSGGESGWWYVLKSKAGTIHLATLLPDDKEPHMYLICDGALIDEGMAIFFGKMPEGNVFEGEFKSGGMTLSFSPDGGIDGEYEEEVTDENGSKFPYKEAYSGTYKRDGRYLDMTLNTAASRYLIFQNTAINPGLEGFAARYFIKENDAPIAKG